MSRTVDLAWLRDQIQDLEIQPVIESQRIPRFVRGRNTSEKPMVLDAVFLDDLWRLWDRAWTLAERTAA